MEYVIGAVGLFLVIYVITTHNAILTAKNKVKRSWSDVLVQLQQKLKILPDLQAQVQDHKNFESSLLTKIVELRQSSKSIAAGTMSPKEVEGAEAKFTDILKSVSVTVEAYPELKSSDLYKSLMSEIVEQQEEVSSGILIYNSNVEYFNNMISTFPSSIINSMWNKEKVLDSFHSKELPVDKEIGFNPTL